MSDTINAFRQADLSYCNELVLVTQAESLPLRARRAFEICRKIGRTHQDMLMLAKEMRERQPQR